MTRNEQVAKVMGWGWRGYPDDCLAPPFFKVVNDQMILFDWTDWAVIKELQQRMVDDGFWIRMSTDKTGMAFQAERNNEYYFTAVFGSHEEPAAIFELFCKVYEIQGDKE